MSACVCCRKKRSPAEVADVAEVWEGRMDDYCYGCALNRCDAFPGECPEGEQLQ